MKKFKRLLAVVLAVVMVVGIVNLPAKAANQQATLSKGTGGYHCQTGSNRWLLYLDIGEASITGDIYWNNNTVYIDGEAHSGDGVNYAIDGNQLLLCLTFDHAPRGTTHTLVIPKGTVIGDMETQTDLAAVLGKDDTVYEATPVQFSLASGVPQNDLSRYALTFNVTGATGLEDAFWEPQHGLFDNTVYAGATKVSKNGVNYLGADSQMQLYLSYSAVQSGVSTSESMDPFALTIPMGTVLGSSTANLLVTTKALKLDINKNSVSEALIPNATVTLSNDDARNQNGSNIGGFYFYTSEDDGLTDDSTWATRYSFTTGGIYVNGDVVSGAKLVKILPTLYYVAFDGCGITFADGDIVKIEGMVNSNGYVVEYQTQSFAYDGAGNWDVYVAPTDIPVTLTFAGDRGDIQIFTNPDESNLISVGAYTPTDAESGIFLNGTKIESATLYCYATAAEAGQAHFHITQDTTGWNETEGNVLTIKGTFKKDDTTLSIAELSTEFNGSGWVLYTGPSYALTLSPTTEATGINAISANDLPYDTNWQYIYYPDAGDENGVFLNEQKTEVFLKKYGADKWYVCLVDKGITCEKFDIVTIKGSFTYTDGSGTPHKVKFDPFTVYRDDNDWSTEQPTIQAPMDQAEVTIYDLFDLESVSKKTIPGDAYYNLVDLQEKTNVGLRLKVGAIEAPNEVIFTLSKATANNVWVDSGYQVKLVPAVGQLRILTKANDIVATASDIDYSSDFELEFAVADMYAEGTTDLAARKVYVKMNGTEVLSYLDYDLTRELGTYSPAWAYEAVDVESITHQGYELVSATPSVQDISELMGGLSKVSTKAGDQIMVGSAAKATNNALRFKVDFGKAFNTDGQEIKFAFSNNSIAGMWALEDSGYHVALRPGQVLIQAGESDNIPVIVGATIPEDEAIVEIGTYDMEIQKDGSKVSDYARVVYVKINEQQVASWTDKNMNRSLGKNMWVYASANVEADLVSLTSDRYLVKDSAKVYDLFNATKLSKVVLNQGRETELGETKESTNIALRTKVTIEGESSEFKLALSKKVANQYWDIEGSGWQFWFRPTSNQLFIGYGMTEYAVLRGFAIPNEFVLEIGERDTRYNNGEKYGREVYMSIDGVEVLSWIDKDYSRPLGTYLTAWASKDGVVTLESLTTKGYIPVEKNIGVQDLFDASGYAKTTLVQNECTYLGEVQGKNSAIKMHVDVNKSADEFKLATGKMDKTTMWDINASGYQFWFRPITNQVFIGYGMTEYATMVGYNFPEHFLLEIGSKDVYYENGEHYGYQVYIKIDGEVITSWIDEDVSGRKFGTSVVGYASANADVTLSTLYNTYELPVVYNINGEEQESTDFASVESTVVLNKPSKITVTTKKDADYAVTYKGTTIGETELKELEIENAPIGVFTYEATAAKGDTVVVNLETKALTVDEPASITDIAEVMDMPSISVANSTEAPLGNMVDAEGRNRINSAVQMKVGIPAAFNQIRWSMYSDASSMWGYNGYIVKLLNNKIAICYAGAESILAQFNCDLVKPNTTLYVESGVVKCYEDGNYKYDRFYVKVGKTLETMELAAWYDSRERGSYGTTISSYGMDVPGSFTISSVRDVKTITDASTQANKEKLATYETFDVTNYAVYYPKNVVAGASAAIKLYVKDGMNLTSLTVAGKNVIADVKKSSDGGYVYEMSKVTSDITFSYAIQ